MKEQSMAEIWRYLDQVLDAPQELRKPRTSSPDSWLLVKGFYLSYHNKLETVVFPIDLLNLKPYMVT